MFIVLLNLQGGGVTPLVDDDDNVMRYDTATEAKAAGQDNILGNALGGEVIDLEDTHDSF